MKRTREKYEITGDFIDECQTEFNADVSNRIARNAIVTVGSMLGATNVNRLKEISHIFLNTVKRQNLKATDQGHTGRCWMFAALNAFRHILVKVLNLSNFEFSETYLFFWDKLERSNTYLQWFIDNPEKTTQELPFNWMTNSCMEDGGWWSSFANLIEKYGIVPKDVMNESFQSSESDTMNRIIKDILNSTANLIMKKRKRVGKSELIKIKNRTVKQIYNILVKYFGEPPRKFEWRFTDSDGESNVITDLTPILFAELVIPELCMTNFVSLACLPVKPLVSKRKYSIKHTSNIVGGRDCEFLNVNIEELEKYAAKSISLGIAVWFAADVMKHFNYAHSALDDELDDSDLIFGNEPKRMTKGERMLFKSTQGTHAMCLVGFNSNEKGQVTSWQVENSWGYWDNETPGADGFLWMSKSWFRRFVSEIVIHKKLLSRTMSKLAEQEPEQLEPWNSVAPGILRVGCVDAPKGYRDAIKLRR